MDLEGKKTLLLGLYQSALAAVKNTTGWVP